MADPNFRGVNPSVLLSLLGRLNEASGSYRGLVGLVSQESIGTNFQGALSMPDLARMGNAADWLAQAASIAKSKYSLVEDQNADDDDWIGKHHGTLREVRNSPNAGGASPLNRRVTAAVDGITLRGVADGVVLTDSERARIDAGVGDKGYAPTFYQFYRVEHAERNVDWATGKSTESPIYRTVSKATRAATIYYPGGDRERLVRFVTAADSPRRSEVFLLDHTSPVRADSAAAVAASVINRPYARLPKTGMEPSADEIRETQGLNLYLSHLRLLAARNANAHPEVAFLLLSDQRYATSAVLDAIYHPRKGAPIPLWDDEHYEASLEYQAEFGRILKSALADYPAQGETADIQKSRLQDAEKAWLKVLRDLAPEVRAGKAENEWYADSAVLRQIGELSLVYFGKNPEHFQNPDFRDIHRHGIIRDGAALAAYEESITSLITADTVARLVPWRKEFERIHGRPPTPDETADFLEKTAHRSGVQTVVRGSEKVLYEATERDVAAREAAATAVSTNVNSASMSLIAGANAGLKLALPEAAVGGAGYSLGAAVIPGLIGLAIYKAAADYTQSKADHKGVNELRGIQGVRGLHNEAVLKALEQAGFVSAAEAAHARTPDASANAKSANAYRSETWSKAGKAILGEDLNVRRDLDAHAATAYREEVERVRKADKRRWVTSG